MKKFIFAVLIAFITLTGASAIEAKVVSVTGKVELQRGSSWVAVRQGDILQKGAVISTGFNSSAVLSVNGTTLTVGALTRMTIEQLAENANKDDTQVYLDSGKVQADVKHTEDRRSDFKVRSPVATASVRGTQIQMYADGSFATFEGMADYGPAEAQSAQIQDDLAPDEQPRANGTSSVFTSANEVGGSYGTPVYAGWESTTDTITGEQANPQDLFVQNSQTFASSTVSLAASETSGLFNGSASASSASDVSVPTAKITVKVKLNN